MAGSCGDVWRDPEEFLPLRPAVLNILLSLAAEERHGYGIMVDVRERTGGKVGLGPGTLYRSINQLLEKNFIEESRERPDPEIDDQRRRYYRLTGLGQRVLSAEMDRLEDLVQEARARGVGPRPRTLPEGA